MDTTQAVEEHASCPLRRHTAHGCEPGIRGRGRVCRVRTLLHGTMSRHPLGGVTLMEHRKGRHRGKAIRPGSRHTDPVRPCAWCAHPVPGEAVTVTFPDQAQVTFLVACLDQYRAVMGPWAAP
jgi:hypothetical protein